MDETNATRILGIQGGGVAAALVQAEGALAAGRLMAAADTLVAALEGTSAAHAAAPWVQGTRARASADQALQLLRAHAATLAASLA